MRRVVEVDGWQSPAPRLAGMAQSIFARPSCQRSRISPSAVAQGAPFHGELLSAAASVVPSLLSLLCICAARRRAHSVWTVVKMVAARSDDPLEAAPAVAVEPTPPPPPPPLPPKTALAEANVRGPTAELAERCERNSRPVDSVRIKQQPLQ